MVRSIRLAGHDVPVIGQGTWFMGEGRAPRSAEVAALREGIEQGLTLIDTAEMYAEGGAEEVVGEALQGYRDQVFLVSKVYPHNAGRHGLSKACERSLARLKTDYLDLYLLHWRGQFPLDETVAAMESMVQQGKIKAWGVSNLDIDDMKELSFTANCQTDQVLYNLNERGVEYDLLPWLRQQQMPMMAYCPLGQASRRLLSNPTLVELAHARGVTPAQLALAWVVRDEGVIAIPKATELDHVRQNAAALNIVLSVEERAALDRAFPVPTGAQPLNMV